MADPLSIAASVGGLLSLASQISLFLVTTITTVSTAPESVKMLKQEFSSLCIALASLEKSLNVDHIARRADFPKEDLSNILNCMMGDFIVLQAALGKLVPRPTDSKMKLFKKRLAWAFREKEVINMKNNVEAYKSTILIMVTTAALMTTSATSNDVSALTTQFRKLSKDMEHSRAICMPISKENRTPYGLPSVSFSRMVSLERIQGPFLHDRGRPLQHYANDASSIRSGSTAQSRISDRHSARYSQYTYGAQSIIDIYLDSIRATSSSSLIHAEILMFAPWEKAFQILCPRDQQSFHFIITSSNIDILSQISSITNQRRELITAGEFKLVYGGRVMVIGEVVDKVIAWMDRFENIRCIVTSADLVHAALPLAVFRFLLMMVGEDRSRIGTVFIIFERLMAILARCEIYEGLYLKGVRLSPVLEHLEMAMVQLYATILAFLAKTKRFYETGQPEQMVGGNFDIEGFQPSIDTINRAEMEVYNTVMLVESTLDRSEYQQPTERCRLRELLTEIEEPIVRIDGQVNDILVKFDEARRTHILKWISPIQNDLRHAQHSDRRLDGTGEWLLKTKAYTEWYRSDRSSILWLHGPPGSGKSTLVSLVINRHLEELKSRTHNEGFAYFYCSYYQQDYSDPPSIFRSLLKQLSVHPRVPALYVPVIREYNLREKNNFGLGDFSLNECKTLIIELLNMTPKTTIIIDGLDECLLKSPYDHSTRDDLLGALKELVSARIKGLVKIFTSSRVTNDITKAFKEVSNLDIRQTATSGGITEDIAMFVEKVVSETIRAKQLLGGNVSESLFKTICTALERNSNGMLLWIHLEINMLGTMSTESEVIEQLSSLPTGLGEIYESIFVQGIDKGTVSGKRLAYLAMMWILCSVEPLSPQKLVARSVTALMVESADSDATVGSDIDIGTILKLCHNLVVIDQQLGVMRFVHASVREFLQLRWNQKETNGMAATVCLTILLEGTPQNMSDTYDDSAEIYALRHWHTHVRLCGDGITTPKVVELLQRFLGSFETPSNAFISWLNSHKYLKWWYSSESLDNPNKFICAPPSVMPTICYYGFSDIIMDMWNSDQRFDVNMINGLGHPLLSIACGQGNEWIISELIKRGAQIDQFCEQYEVALSYAAEKGQEGAFQLLLDNGADVNRVGDNNVSALSIATHKGYAGIAQIILNNGGHRHIEYALEIACVNGQLAVLKILFENGADRSPHGSALFHSLRHTAELRKEECLKFLLSIVEEHKAEILQLDLLASNTLAAAVRGGSFDIIRLIYQEFDGADMDLPSKWWGKTALQIALEEERLDVVNFLLVRGAKLGNVGLIELEDLAWAYNEPWYGELTALISNIQEPFSCTIEETLRVRKIFRKSFGLPLATVDRILELGEYWVKIRREREAIVRLTKDDDQEVPYISLLIKSNLRSPVRKIIFTIRSHDQGRTIDDYSILGKGSYYASCTSFETAIHSSDSVTPENSREVQRNLTCTERAHTQIITWDYRDNQSVAEWMKSLTTGYFLGVYPRVLHSGWENTVERVDLQLFLAWGDIESELSEETVSCGV